MNDTIVSIDIKYPASKKYILKLELTDLNRIDAVNRYLWLDNSGPSSPENSRIKDEEGEILFTQILEGDDRFYLEITDREAQKVFVRYYDRDFPLALPPFLEETEANFDYRADSVFVIEVEDGYSSMIQLPDVGFYHFQTDSNERGGYTLFRFEQGFPEILSTEQMLDPMRYITTTAEFDEMRNAVDVKLAVDNFWLNNAGNPTRARAMIQKYYGRVVDANRYFTSYHDTGNRA